VPCFDSAEVEAVVDVERSGMELPVVVRSAHEHRAVTRRTAAAARRVVLSRCGGCADTAAD
jgi:hypothetical protein